MPGGGPDGAGGAARRGPSLPLELMTRRGGAAGPPGAAGAPGAGRPSAAAAAGRGAGAAGGASDGAGALGSAGALAAAGASGTALGADGAAGWAVAAAGFALSAAGFAFSAAGFDASDAAAAFLPPFFSAAGSSGWVSRTRPSRSALRRTRSACASTMLDEWLFTPIPSAAQRSSVSLFVSPSSRANSYTRMFGGKSCPQPFFVASSGGHTCAAPLVRLRRGSALCANGAMSVERPRRRTSWCHTSVNAQRPILARSRRIAELSPRTNLDSPSPGTPLRRTGRLADSRDDVLPVCRG